MKKLLLALLASTALVAQAESSFDSPGGLEFRLGGILPSETYWDEVGIMGDLGIVFWGSDRALGLWIGGGVQALTLNWTDGFDTPYITDITGANVGASILLRGEIFSGLAIRMEGGARFMFLDIADDPDYYHRRDHFNYKGYYSDAASDLDIENTALAVVSIALELNLQPLVFAVGGGYQFDLINPEISYLGETFAETDFSGAFAFVNLGIAF